jgi:hypothetical protein
MTHITRDGDVYPILNRARKAKRKSPGSMREKRCTTATIPMRENLRRIATGSQREASERNKVRLFMAISRHRKTPEPWAPFRAFRITAKLLIYETNSWLLLLEKVNMSIAALYV